jgi:hypothetical protein
MDDLSTDPISDGEWEQMLVAIFMEMLERAGDRSLARLC